MRILVAMILAFSGVGCDKHIREARGEPADRDAGVAIILSVSQLQLAAE